MPLEFSCEAVHVGQELFRAADMDVKFKALEKRLCPQDPLWQSMIPW